MRDDRPYKASQYYMCTISKKQTDVSQELAVKSTNSVEE